MHIRESLRSLEKAERKTNLPSYKVDFHCGVVFTCVNRLGAMYLNVARKIKKNSLDFYFFARPFIQRISFIYARKNYATVEIHPCSIFIDEMQDG